MSYVINPGLPSHAFSNVARDRLKRDVASRKEVAEDRAALRARSRDRRHRPLAVPAIPRRKVRRHRRAEGDARRRSCNAIRRSSRSTTASSCRSSPCWSGWKRAASASTSRCCTRCRAKMGAQLAATRERDLRRGGDGVQHQLAAAARRTSSSRSCSIPVLKKTKGTKAYSTNVEVLQELASHGFAVPKLILLHRELHKLKSTYIDALPQLVAKDGRVHTSFNQAVAATGRLSSSDPNLQNIPIRTELGRDDPQGVHRRRGQRAARGRLLAGRAAHPRAHLAGRGADRDVPARRGHSSRHRVEDVQRPRGSS